LSSATMAGGSRTPTSSNPGVSSSDGTMILPSASATAASSGVNQRKSPRPRSEFRLATSFLIRRVATARQRFMTDLKQYFISLLSDAMGSCKPTPVGRERLQSQCENSIRLSFREDAGDEESRTALKISGSAGILPAFRAAIARTLRAGCPRSREPHDLWVPISGRA